MEPALTPFIEAFRDPQQVTAAAAAQGQIVVRTLGLDAPRELILAAGLLPIRLVSGTAAATPRADALIGQTSMGPRGRRLLEQLLSLPDAEAPLLITQADADQPQLFAALRELGRLGEPAPRNLHFLDLLHIDRPAIRTYNLHRIHGLVRWLQRISGSAISGDDIAAAQSLSARQAQLLEELDAQRRQGRLSGTSMLHIFGAAAVMPPLPHIEAMRHVLNCRLPERQGTRLFVTGSPHENADLYELIESCGATIVGEDHGWGMPYARGLDWQATGAIADFADPARRPVAAATSANARADRLAMQVAECGATHVLHLSIDGDEAAPWDVAAAKRALPAAIRFMAVRTGGEPLRPQISAFLADAVEPGQAPAKTGQPAPAKAARPQPGDPQRSRKALASVATFSAYQRDWFADVRRQVAAGAPFAMVNANAPQEILRALDIPFVVNQWWASIVAAKQQSKRYSALLKAHDYPADVEAYSAQGLAAAFDEDPDQAPWGGLPRPDFVHAVASSDPTLKMFEQWAHETGADCYVYARTVDPRAEITVRWWDDLPERWDEALEAERIDLLVAELRDVIARLEGSTGRTFSQQRFIEVMELVNEQEDYYRRTRELVASTVPAPISIVDSMPATMVPQWHRGTEWGRDAAKAFYEEVKARADAGLGAAADEKIRLMWVGRGLWSNTGFYQQWEESHGAVFVWSMYLALAADGYIRSTSGGRDYMRALAARFLTMGDELRMPTWAGAWHVHEAETHVVDAAVAISDADPFVIRALRQAGIPVLELQADNFTHRAEESARLEQLVTDFIEGPATERARMRSEHVCA